MLSDLPHTRPTEGPRAATVAHDTVDLIRGGAVNTVGTAVGAIRTLFLVLVARLLGDSVLGTFSLAWVTIDLAAKVASLGLAVGITPHVARADAEDGDIKALLLTAVPVGLAGSLVVAGLLMVGARVFASPVLGSAVALMALAMPGVVLYRISNGVSRGLRIMRHNVYSRGFAESFVTLAVFLTVFAVGGQGRTPIVAMVAGTTAGGLVAFWLALGVARGSGGFSLTRARHLIRFSLPVAGYGLVNLLMQRLDVLLLGVFVGRAPGLDLSTFGAYAAAVEIAGVMRRIRQTFEPIYAPVVARRLAVDDWTTVRGVMAQIGRWTLVLQLPLAGVLVVSGSLVLAVFGPSFAIAAPWLSLLVVAHGLFNFFGLAEALLLARRPVLNLWNSCLAAIIQLGLTLWLVPRYGIVGAPLAMIAAHAALGLFRLVELRWLFAMRWPWRTLVRPTILSALAFAVAVGVRSLVPGPSGWVAAGVTLLAIVLVGWWRLGLDEGDRATIAELRRRVRGRRAAVETV